MLEDFLSYIESNLSVFREDKLLLSVSGGIDSMVMLHLFKMSNYTFSVAHLNHSTRNGGSDKDMEFVASFCKKHQIPFHSKTVAYDQLSQGNFQQNARNERFHFLTELKEQHGFKWIATAHHAEDRWETFLMHLNRKSGIKGLTSLREKEGSLIHPLLIFTKEEIQQFVEDHAIEYTHDISNDSNDYLRNTVRHKITPASKEVFPDFISNVSQSRQILSNEQRLLQELLDKSGLSSTVNSKGVVYFDLDSIRSYANSNTLLFHLIEPYGFNYSDAKDMLQSSTSGALFSASAYEALRDRGKLIVRPMKKRIEIDLDIDAHGTYELADGRSLNVDQNDMNSTRQLLWLDHSKLKWPLKVRSLLPGDSFKPEGMKGSTKTLKKLCSDLKINRFDKEELLVVTQNEKIVQVVGIRTAYNYGTSDIKNAITFNIVE